MQTLDPGANLTLTLDGKEIPCQMTMGTAVRYKEMTGKEMSAKIDGTTDLCRIAYCMAQSACARRGIAFDYSFMDFADALTPADLAALSEQMFKTVQAQADDKKKPRRALKK